MSNNEKRKFSTTTGEGLATKLIDGRIIQGIPDDEGKKLMMYSVSYTVRTIVSIDEPHAADIIATSEEQAMTIVRDMEKYNNTELSIAHNSEVASRDIGFMKIDTVKDYNGEVE